MSHKKMYPCRNVLIILRLLVIYSFFNATDNLIPLLFKVLILFYRKREDWNMIEKLNNSRGILYWSFESIVNHVLYWIYITKDEKEVESRYLIVKEFLHKFSC